MKKRFHFELLKSYLTGNHRQMGNGVSGTVLNESLFNALPYVLKKENEVVYTEP